MNIEQLREEIARDEGVKYEIYWIIWAAYLIASGS